MNKETEKITVSHILVHHEYEALDILRALREGKTFEQLALKYSRCSSADKGGFLGEVDTHRLDEDFSFAALKLNPGEISTKPVRTRFGFHLIKREK